MKQQHPTLPVRPNPRNRRLKPRWQQRTHHSLPRLPPPTTKADDTTVPPKPVSPPPPDTQSTPVAATPGEQNQATTPTDIPAPPELKAFTDALKGCQGLHRRQKQGPAGGQEFSGDQRHSGDNDGADHGPWPDPRRSPQATERDAVNN